MLLLIMQPETYFEKYKTNTRHVVIQLNAFGVQNSNMVMILNHYVNSVVATLHVSCYIICKMRQCSVLFIELFFVTNDSSLIYTVNQC